MPLRGAWEPFTPGIEWRKRCSNLAQDRIAGEGEAWPSCGTGGVALAGVVRRGLSGRWVDFSAIWPWCFGVLVHVLREKEVGDPR